LRQDNYVYGAVDLLFESWRRNEKQIPAQQEQLSRIWVATRLRDE
jgi:hypothetical protein